MGRMVNINGALMPPDRAFISVYDRGFLYGDSVYEVLRTYEGRLFEAKAHLDRLRHSGELIGLALPQADAALRGELERTIEAACNQGESYVRLIVTRGTGEISLDPAVAEHPNVVVLVEPLKSPPAEAYANGVKIQLVGVRRNLREAVDPAAKTGNYLNSVLALREARRSSAHEAVMLDRNGWVTEGASSSVFLLEAGRLVTPALCVGILEGITRRIVLELARDQGIACEERDVAPEELERADEVFITSTTREVLPVTQVGERRIAGGRPGALTTQLLQAFRARARAALQGQ